MAVLESPQILIKKSQKRGFDVKTHCSAEPVKENKHIERTYQTIGACSTIIDLATHVKKWVDTIQKKTFKVETVANHTTSYKVLSNTNKCKRTLKDLTRHAQKLVKRTITLPEVYYANVDIDVVCTKQVDVQSVSHREQVVQTVKEVQRDLKTLKPNHVQARRVTDRNGCIDQVKRVHEIVHQTAKRTVACPSHHPHLPAICSVAPAVSH
jgi:hypothetical protein